MRRRRQYRRTVDLAGHEARKRGDVVQLMPVEFRLLAALIRGRGWVLTHRQLLHEVWGSAYADGPQYLRAHMADLRHKLKDAPTQPKPLMTELQAGHRLFEL